MGSLTNYGENVMLDHLTGKTSWTMTVAYIALSSTDFTETGGSGTEPTTPAGYMRKATAGADWNVAGSGTTSNANAITFNQASPAWGAVSYFSIWTNATPATGTPLAYGALTVAKTVGIGDTLSFAAGALVITAD